MTGALLGIAVYFIEESEDDFFEDFEDFFDSLLVFLDIFSPLLPCT